MEVNGSGELKPKSLLSNESIIYTYLSFKQELIDLDNKLKHLEVFIAEKDKEFESMFGEQSERFKQLSILASKMTGEQLNPDELRKAKDLSFEELRKTVGGVLKEAMEYRINIINELQTPFDVLKDMYPELIEKLNKHFSSKTLKV